MHIMIILLPKPKSQRVSVKLRGNLKAIKFPSDRLERYCLKWFPACCRDESEKGPEFSGPGLP